MVACFCAASKRKMYGRKIYVSLENACICKGFVVYSVMCEFLLSARMAFCAGEPALDADRALRPARKEGFDGKEWASPDGTISAA